MIVNKVIKKLQYQDLNIPYCIIYKKMKHMNLRVNKEGMIEVHCNEYIPDHKIEAFIQEKLDWLMKAKQKVEHRKNLIFVEDEFDQGMGILGKQIKFSFLLSKYNHVSLENDILVVYHKDGYNVNKLIQGFIDRSCKEVFMEICIKTHTMLEDYHLAFPQIKYRTMSTRWGSCTPKKNLITLNKKMIHYDIRFIEYVILHEFVHFMQPNHSKSFYQIIERYMPDYKERQKLVHS